MGTENFIIVRRKRNGAAVGNISEIVRSYLSRSRAEQDLDLLQRNIDDYVFEIITVTHIDD